MGSDVAVLDGSTALVTGATGGLGRIQAFALGRAGARIIAADLDLAAAESLVADLGEEGLDASPARLDVTDARGIEELFAGLGGGWIPDILVNNAGVSIRQSALDATPEVFDLTHAVNVRGAYFVAQAAARAMRPRGGGRIVNIASIGGLVVDGPQSSVYDASKAAVVQMTKNQASEWGRWNIRVNAIAPGYMRTAMTADLLPDAAVEQRIVDQHIPLGRVGEPADLAGPVVFLASEASAYVTGHCLTVDGGWLVAV
ncbi:hypothetical protein BHE97_01825 [Aeromicrobium sp. PE09-221]|uniref:SDR family NAD(P)-dependent oxidoreductase n=1 Tax=Aeromicrobium sp. PE09-221 TaxID=1898043 RepID=UPI000B3E5F99|nr:glucose 1-dehydrogenase [Aeromicrobium sp. PE09-221]OUZ12470.1 hypothetical protein BHE97_01825 [Aeromicrobium sp. PE09-221]